MFLLLGAHAQLYVKCSTLPYLEIIIKSVRGGVASVLFLLPEISGRDAEWRTCSDPSVGPLSRRQRNVPQVYRV